MGFLSMAQPLKGAEEGGTRVAYVYLARCLTGDLDNKFSELTNLRKSR
eukprot:NODE_9956_length_200_cov_28.331126_g9873_i0.p1 GENE.NODE_9956_length_200_cov_28.331126_g9873_i0~~NODE_9956_length_200_cov_28.331126_g9873_i0.p1  ORF type:complete len:56 (-),score=15.03 NODE_9956_length_200_cov_28.331126_g9873_i0:31-174(-)